MAKRYDDNGYERNQMVQNHPRKNHMSHYCPNQPKIFDVNALRESIAKQWGQYGAHMEVLNDLIKAAKAQ